MTFASSLVFLVMKPPSLPRRLHRCVFQLPRGIVNPERLLKTWDAVQPRQSTVLFQANDDTSFQIYLPLVMFGGAVR